MSGKSKTPPADIRHALLEALRSIDRPGDVCIGGDWPLTLPGLEVPGLGPVSLPLTEVQARKLIRQCRQAPYGKGTETVVDTDVRRVWELDPERFQLTNPKWEQCVASLVAQVQEALGLVGQKLTAQLYKLLVYEKGSFFLPHRDGEKLDRMVATLVIGLPSVHGGGELVVWHDGRQYENVFGGAATGHELSYAAFYADCQHEVRPLRSGYRLCLTYNLTLAKSRGKQGIGAPSYGPTVSAIGQSLAQWRESANSEKLAITLDHRYTQDGLGIDKLKGIDRARAEVLFEAAEQAGCAAHLALVTLWQSGSAEGGYDDYSYRSGRGRRYHWSDEDDEEDEDDEAATGYEMGELIDWSLSADHWTDRQGNKVSLGAIPLSEDDIVADEPIDESEPNREDFEGYTGNAGMTLERWYHRAAVIIWPRAKHFQVLCDAGTDAAVGGLEAMVKGLKRAAQSKRQQQRQECLSFAGAIIDSWKPGGHVQSWGRLAVDRSVFPQSLCELNAPDLVRRFLSEVMPADRGVQLDKSFGTFARQHGWESFERELAAVFDATSAATLSRNAELLRILSTLRDKNPQRIKLCGRLAERMVQAVEGLDNKPGRRDWQLQTVDRAGLLQSLVAAMLAVEAERPLGRLIDHALSCQVYDLTDAHLAVIFALEKQLARRTTSSHAVSRWLRNCRRELESRTSQAPHKPTDYRRDAGVSCKCSDCGALAKFLADPELRQARFPLAKDRREHLHRVIDGNGLDCTHVTERRGSPYTLVCTKTTASYEAACKTYQRDLTNLKRLTRLETELP